MARSWCNTGNLTALHRTIRNTDNFNEITFVGPPGERKKVKYVNEQLLKPNQNFQSVDSPIEF